MFYNKTTNLPLVAIQVYRVVHVAACASSDLKTPFDTTNKNEPEYNNNGTTNQHNKYKKHATVQQWFKLGLVNDDGKVNIVQTPTRLILP